MHPIQSSQAITRSIEELSALDPSAELSFLQKSHIQSVLSSLEGNVDLMTSKQRASLLRILPRVSTALSNGSYEAIRKIFRMRVYQGEANIEALSTKIQGALADSLKTRRIYKQLSPALKAPFEEKTAIAIGVANQINAGESSSTKAQAVPFIQEPLSNLEKKPGLENPMEKYVKLVSYERFHQTLRVNFLSLFSDFLALSEESPPPYILIGSSKNKSTNWAISQVLDLMERHPPSAIIYREYVGRYLQNHPDTQDVFMIDDGSYSGEQAKKYILDLTNVRGKKLHICIPYITSTAREKMEKAAKENGLSLAFSPYQRIFTYQEHKDLGYFGYTEMNRPCFALLLEVEPVDESIEDAPRVNAALLDIHKNLFKRKERETIQAVLALQETISPRNLSFANILAALQWATGGYQPRMGVDPRQTRAVDIAYYERFPDWTRSVHSKSPIWLAHKALDDVSTITKLTGQAVTGYSISPPYHRTSLAISKRTKEVQDLLQKEEQKKGDLALNVQYAPFQLQNEKIVTSNRGVFLLSNNYIDTSEAEESLKLTVNGYTFLFGGREGLFQYKLEEGHPFSLERLGNPSSRVTLLYQNGQLLEGENPS